MIRGHESEAARVHVHAAGNQVHPVGQPVAMTANANQIAPLDESPESAAKRRALIGAPSEPFHQLAHRGGMVHLPAQRIEELVRGDHRGAGRHPINATCRSPTLVSVGPV